MDALRRRRSHRRIVGPDGEEALARATADGPGPHELAEVSEFQQELERALQVLPETQRAIVVLREIQGLKYEEIAAALELPLNTVKVYLHRARRELREHLHKSMGND